MPGQSCCAWRGTFKASKDVNWVFFFWLLTCSTGLKRNKDANSAAGEAGIKKMLVIIVRLSHFQMPCWWGPQDSPSLLSNNPEANYGLITHTHTHTHRNGMNLQNMFWWKSFLVTWIHPAEVRGVIHLCVFLIFWIYKGFIKLASLWMSMKIFFRV